MGTFRNISWPKNIGRKPVTLQYERAGVQKMQHMKWNNIWFTISQSIHSFVTAEIYIFEGKLDLGKQPRKLVICIIRRTCDKRYLSRKHQTNTHFKPLRYLTAKVMVSQQELNNQNINQKQHFNIICMNLSLQISQFTQCYYTLV